MNYSNWQMIQCCDDSLLREIYVSSLEKLILLLINHIKKMKTNWPIKGIWFAPISYPIQIPTVILIKIIFTGDKIWEKVRSMNFIKRERASHVTKIGWKQRLLDRFKKIWSQNYSLCLVSLLTLKFKMREFYIITLRQLAIALGVHLNKVGL